MVSSELRGDVLHIASPEKSVNYRWEEESDKLPPELQIVSIDEINSLPMEEKRKRFATRNLSQDMVLFLEPYSNQYIPATDAERIFFDRKFDALTTVASLLGASKISCKVEMLSLKRRELDASGNISYKKIVDANASAKSIHLEEYKNRYEKCREYSSPGLTMDGYLQAKKILEQTGLIYDQDFKNLLDQRNPSHPNPIKRETYHIELSKELNDSLEIAFSLNVLKGVFSLNTNVKETISSAKTLLLETIVEF